MHKLPICLLRWRIVMGVTQHHNRASRGGRPSRPPASAKTDSRRSGDRRRGMGRSSPSRGYEENLDQRTSPKRANVAPRVLPLLPDEGRVRTRNSRSGLRLFSKVPQATAMNGDQPGCSKVRRSFRLSEGGASRARETDGNDEAARQPRPHEYLRTRMARRTAELVLNAKATARDARMRADLATGMVRG